jgi:hypothetical protein
MGGCSASDSKPDENASTGGDGVGAAGITPATGGTVAGTGGTTTTPGTGGSTTPSTGGAGGMDMSTGGAGGAGGTGGAGPSDGTDPRGCPGLKTKWPGDGACMLPPDPAKGFQIHIGPTNYDDPADTGRFVFQVGAEKSQCWNFHTTNPMDAHYSRFVLSGRDGTHHIINTMYMTDAADSTNFTTCRPGEFSGTDVIDALPGAGRSYMPTAPIAPENVGLGRAIPAKAFAQSDMHYFNFTDGEILREYWLNVYYNEGPVTEEALPIRGMGGTNWYGATAIKMQATAQVFNYKCPAVKTAGRLIALMGHQHSHGKRFDAWLNHGTERKHLYQNFDYTDPKVYLYDSLAKNPDFSANSAGAATGQIDIAVGDVLEWECEVLNDDVPGGLTYTNEVKNGEMCNVWGETVGPKIDCFPDYMR